MRPLWPVLVLLLLATLPGSATARVLNLEFKFAPFIGDPATADEVRTVPGTARVFINGISISEQAIEELAVPVLFDSRQIAAPVWVPVAMLGPVVRRGANTLRIEFDPVDLKKPYNAQIRWALVTDETTTTELDSAMTSTSQAGEGVENRVATGALVFERPFIADFAIDYPWHHAPPVTALSKKDEEDLNNFVLARARAFEPDFSKFFALLEGMPDLDIAGMRNQKCVERAYESGLRVAGPVPGQLELVTTGHAEVILRATKGPLFRPIEPPSVKSTRPAKIGECLDVALTRVYPPRLVVVRNESGGWEVVY